MGVAVMRPMTSGIFQQLAAHLAPEWHAARDLYRVALEFVLSDARVHVANVGMRWPHEVERNVEIASRLGSEFDAAQLPRMTVDIYRTEDEEHTA